MSKTPRIERPDEYRWVCKSCGRALTPIEVTYEETHDGCGGIAVPIETKLISKLEHDAIVDQQDRDIAGLVDSLEAVVKNFNRALAGNPVKDAVECIDHAHNLIAKHRKEKPND